MYQIGMPIAACADKLKREIQQYGNPPVFPAVVEEPVAAPEPVAVKKDAKKGAPPAASTNDDEEGDEDEEVEEVVEVKGVEKKVKTVKKKGKLAGKKAKQTYQWDIMKDMGVPTSEIAKFQDARHWLRYFPPIAMVC
jgi:leucyl-tRNA synthetase